MQKNLTFKDFQKLLFSTDSVHEVGSRQVTSSIRRICVSIIQSGIFGKVSDSPAVSAVATCLSPWLCTRGTLPGSNQLYAPSWYYYFDPVLFHFTILKLVRWTISLIKDHKTHYLSLFYDWFINMYSNNWHRCVTNNYCILSNCTGTLNRSTSSQSGYELKNVSTEVI